MAGLISTTYGTALFDVCVEENRVDEFMKEMLFVKETLRDSEEFLKY